METQEIFDRVVKIISEFVKEPERLNNVSMDTLIIQDLKVNSARLVDIIIQAEDAFDIGIDDDDADQIRTVGDAVQVVKRKLAAA